MEPSPCTPPRGELSKDTKKPSEAPWFGGSHNYKTKQNKLPSLIDRLYDIGVCGWPSKCSTICPTLHSLCLGKGGLPHLDLSKRCLRTIMWSPKCLDNHPKETKKPIMSGHTWSDPLH